MAESTSEGQRRGYEMRTDKTVCEYCGKEKDGLFFCIGASKDPDWCMIEGTGKMTCPDCYGLAMKEGQERIERHLHSNNQQKERIKC